MDGDRTVSMLVQPDQWARCAHDRTTLLPGGGAELDWIAEEPVVVRPERPANLPGLAFDRLVPGLPLAPGCRPRRGAVDGAWATRPSAMSWCPDAGRVGWPSTGASACTSPRRAPDSVLVVDLSARRILRRIGLGPRRPVDVAADCGRVFALLRRPDSIVLLDGRRGPGPGPPYGTRDAPTGCSRLASVRGRWCCGSGGGHGVIATPDGRTILEVDGATDLDVIPDGVMVVARGTGQSFRRFAAATGTWLELEPDRCARLRRRRDRRDPGRADRVHHSGRLHDDHGLRCRAPAPRARVVTYRLDSGDYRTRWGRMFLDACLPPGTSVTARFLTSDDDDDPVDAVPATRPARGAGLIPQAAQDDPPLPSRDVLDAVGHGHGALPATDGQGAAVAPDCRRRPVRDLRGAGGRRPRPLSVGGAAPARDRQVTPRVRAMRVERPGHQLLEQPAPSVVPGRGGRRLPAALPGSGRGRAARAGLAGRRSAPSCSTRRSTPQETLPWLASFAGLVLDRRWPEPARRTLVAEAYPLFARRGTKAGAAAAAGDLPRPGAVDRRAVAAARPGRDRARHRSPEGLGRAGRRRIGEGHRHPGPVHQSAGGCPAPTPTDSPPTGSPCWFPAS